MNKLNPPTAFLLGGYSMFLGLLLVLIVSSNDGFINRSLFVGLSILVFVVFILILGFSHLFENKDAP